MLKITKNDALFLKGIAILLMLFHHLFAFPERIGAELIYINSEFNIEFLVASFGKICVSIFLFLSGYGFASIGKRDIKYYFSKVFSFYKSYWLVFLIFIPLGTAFFNSTGRYSLTLLELAQSFLGLSSVYNGEWWFIEVYIALVLFTPIINIFRTNQFVLLSSSFLLFLFYLYLIKNNLDTPIFSLAKFLFWQGIYVIGFIIGSMNKEVFLKHFKTIDENEWGLFIFFVVVIMLFYMLFNTLGLVVATPLFIYCCLYIKSKSNKFIIKILEHLGEHSMFMWLTHSFYCYYFFRDVLYSIQYTILIYIVLIIISYVTSLLLKKIQYFNYDRKLL